jgi:hypothetical protein
MKKLFIILVCIILVSILTNSCRFLGICEDSNLSLQKMSSAKNYLKVNGFYYEDTLNGALTAHYLYDNGIIIKDIGIPINELPNYKIMPNQNQHLQSCKGCWGVFLIENNKIIVEKWQSNFNGCVTTYREEGEILNDSTFTLKKVNNKNVIYRFMYSTSKPDSTNNFIK